MRRAIANSWRALESVSPSITDPGIGRKCFLNDLLSLKKN